MPQQTVNIETIVAVTRLNNHDYVFWGEFYDKYAPIMYGLCLKIAGNEKTAIEIFKLAFIEVKQARLLTDITPSDTLYIIKYTCNAAFDYLKIEDKKTAAKQLLKNNFLL